MQRCVIRCMAHRRRFPRHKFLFCPCVIAATIIQNAFNVFVENYIILTLEAFALHRKWHRATILMANGLKNFIMTIKRFTFILKQKVFCAFHFKHSFLPLRAYYSTALFSPASLFRMPFSPINLFMAQVNNKKKCAVSIFTSRFSSNPFECMTLLPFWKMSTQKHALVGLNVLLNTFQTNQHIKSSWTIFYALVFFLFHVTLLCVLDDFVLYDERRVVKTIKVKCH